LLDAYGRTCSKYVEAAMSVDEVAATAIVTVKKLLCPGPGIRKVV
jgi:hypothetical protein